MYIPSSYLSRLSLKETQKAMFKFKRNFMKDLLENFELEEVLSPLINSSDDASPQHELMISRSISFDSVNNHNIYFLLNDSEYWLRNTLKKYDMKNNSGIISEFRIIQRDEKISNSSSMEKNLYVIEYRFDNEDLAIKKLEEVLQKIYDILVENLLSLKISFPKLTLNLDDELRLFDLSLERERRISQKDYEIKDYLTAKEGAAIFLNKSKKYKATFDENYDKAVIEIAAHSKIFPGHFPLVEGRIRRSMLKPDLSLRVEDQLSINEFDFIKQKLDKDTPNSLNVSIDINAILLLFLQKATIFELCSGTLDNESEQFLKQKAIKHI